MSSTKTKPRDNPEDSIVNLHGMKEVESKLISSLKIEDSGVYCLIELYPEFPNSKKEKALEKYYTIVKLQLLKAYGGLPRKILIQPSDSPLGNENLFKIDNNRKPATFEGIPLQSDSQKFWTF